MGKRKWRRVRPADLASQEEQRRMAELIAEANEAQAQDLHKRPSETAQEGR